MEAHEPKKFGTFSGVFLPSILAILGAVMYYIAPQIVGGVGLVKTLIIIAIAHSVTIATAFSIAAIVTNIKVKSGGLYYLISRSLGSEFGGSLGIQLYLAQTIAASFYSIAFARGIASILIVFDVVVPEYQLALASLFLFGIMVYIGAQFVVKLQYVIFTAILLSLVSVFFAPHTQNMVSVLSTSSSLPFWIAFAMFFPAVTGIDAGVGMSGDLKNPRKSLVWGTFSAIFLTMIVYIALTFKYALVAPASALLQNPHIVESIAIIPQLVLVGVLMATSSSALSSLMTSPRCLTAMISDKILPRWCHFLGKTSGKNSEPRVAIIFSLILGASVIMIGSLEFVSQIVSMFFLSVYGWINGAAFFEKVSQNPSYRPLFNAPAIVSFYGMVVAYAIMYLFDPVVMLVVIVLQAFIFILLYRSKKSMKFESVWDGVFFQLLKQLMKRMAVTEKSKKNWRPTILAFCANDLNKTAMASVLHWIGAQSSIIKLYFLKKGDIQKDTQEKQRMEHSLNSYVKEYKLEIFPRILMVNNYEETITTLIQSETLGNIPFNTVFVDFDKNIQIDKLISDMVALQKNIVILRNQSGFSDFKRIDVWWSSEKNGNLMILLAYLISHSEKWLEAGTTIRVFTVFDSKINDSSVDVNGQDKSDQCQRDRVQNILTESRIENTELIMVHADGNTISEIIKLHSENSDLVLMGLPQFSQRQNDDEIIENINRYTEKLKVCLIVLANDEIDFRVN